jgi:hypothetical protein
VARESSVWSETDWLSNDDYSFSPSPRFGEKGPGDEGHGSEKLEVRSVNSSEAELGLLTYPSEASSLLIPIEQVPLGARVPTKNPKPWEYDDSLPDPVQADWAKISITMHRNDGGIVDAELIRPGRLLETLGDTPLCSLQQEAEGKFDYDFASLVGNRKRNFLFRTTLAEISAN